MQSPDTGPLELGDAIESALTKLGITKERVSHWLGRPCHCDERQEKLNALSIWAKRVLKGKTQQAKEYLETLTKE